jgi:polyhydroxyalkanoate synthase subunit PhaC
MNHNLSTPEAYAPSAMDLPLKHWLAHRANGISPSSVALAYADWFNHIMASPSKQTELAASAWAKSLLWLQYAQQGWQGGCARCVDPPAQDKRFSRAEWDAFPFGAMAQAFLLQQQWWAEAMTGVRGVSKHHEEVVAFTTRQWLDVWAPSNGIVTNPQVLQQTLASGGANLLNGAVNWWRDALLVVNDGKPRGVEDFVPGKQIAITPGCVVFKNALIELIQYDPLTKSVDAEPILIVPSWIMKYYILDLTPDDSLVKYLVSQGHTVFMLSWRNPDSADRNLGLGDYLKLGVMAAIKAVRSIIPGHRIHAAGYCLGGTLLAVAAAAMGAQRSNPLATLTLLAAQTDFNEPGELGLFVDESQIAFLEDLMAEHGYLDGRQMAGAFQLINSKDLVWSKLVYEYLMGAQTPMTALRAWNADATRLPARMHSEYLRGFYLRNDLAEGRYRVDGSPVSLVNIRLPTFVVATETDHVSPWESVYKIHQLSSAPISFVLSSGGHNVGIVNPLTGSKAHPGASYRFAAHEPGKAPNDPHHWHDAAQPHQGSWWPRWHEWLHQNASGTVKARKAVKLATQGPGTDAPGEYVHQS